MILSNSDMVPSMLIKEPGCQTRSRLTEKLAKVRKNGCAPYYMATPEEKQIDTHLKMEWQMYFSAENLPGVNPVVMNYKIRHSKNQTATRPARYSLMLPDLFSRYHLWWQKNGKTRSGHVRLHARVAMEEGLLSVCVSQSMSQSRSVNEYCYLLNSGFARTRWHLM